MVKTLFLYALNLDRLFVLSSVFVLCYQILILEYFQLSIRVNNLHLSGEYSELLYNEYSIIRMIFF